jgi:3-oxoacyl-[acyl-carrier-protein] synthase-3
LIIGVERLSDITNRSDRSTAFLFADGAGAAVIGPSESSGIGPVVWGSDGDQAPLIQQTEPWDAALAWDRESYRSTDGGTNWPTLKMEGNPVF